jgi:DNA-binding transcriptional MerR regulator
LCGGYAVVEDDYSVNALVQLTRERGIPVEKVKEAIAGQGAEKAADLTKDQLQEVIDRLKQEFSATME